MSDFSSATALKVATRDKLGRGNSRALRRIGALPAVIYSDHYSSESLAITVEAKSFNKEYYKGNLKSRIMKLELNRDNATSEVFTIVREVQVDCISDMPTHVDFQRVYPGKALKLDIRVKAINKDKCASIKRGGTLNIVKHAIECYCIPEQIPQSIEVDVANLAIGRSIHINDLNLGAHIVPVDKSNFVICSISGRSEEEETPATATTK